MCFRASHIKKQENPSGLLTPLQLLFHYSDSLYSQIPQNAFCKHHSPPFPPRGLLHSDTSKCACQGAAEVLGPNLKRILLRGLPLSASALWQRISGASSCSISCASDLCSVLPPYPSSAGGCFLGLWRPLLKELGYAWLLLFKVLLVYYAT